MKKLKIFTDGGSRGNPGPCAIGIVIVDFESGKIIHKISECIGVETNNVAEYTAIEKALEWVLENEKEANIDFLLDSELVCRQLNGQYKVKDQNLKVIYLDIKQKLSEHGGTINFSHIRREDNKEADSLVNHALDTL
ncbi:MAG: ribonuclease HI family protein [Candidatus Berkelbacteria bacterium]|nr:ribonuclease HI family protein [Candidatus Berkelbacteria bacterium]